MRARADLAAAAKAQVPTADYIPYSSHISPNIIKLRGNGEYLSMWRLEGVAFETADQDQVHAWKESLVNFLRAAGGGHWALWSHKVRREIRDSLSGVYQNAFCEQLSAEYAARLHSKKQMATELYLSVIYRPPVSRVVNLFQICRRRKRVSTRERYAEDMDAVNDMGAQLEASLARYNPSRLGTVERSGGQCSEMLSVLTFLTNGFWEDVPLRDASIAEYLPSSRLHFGDQNGMLEIWNAAGKTFAGFLDMQEYPQVAEPGMNNALLYGDYPYIETQSFSMVSRREGLELLKRQQGHLEASSDAAESEVAAITEAMDALQSGHLDLGEYHYSLCVFGQSLVEVAKHMAEARTALQDGPGFKMAVIDAIPECAWFAQLPGNWSMRPREANITSRNFACLSPLHNFARGKRNNNPWGQAIAMMETPSAQPYYFNFHGSPDDEDSTDSKRSGNTFICGTTGSGKTTLALSLVAFATKVKGLRAVLFDKDRGMEIGIRAMGGQYRALQRGDPTGFNPFQLEPTEINITFCEALVRLLVAPGNTVYSTKDETDVRHAVRTVMSDQVHVGLRRLSTVAQSLPVTGENNLRDRLRKWCQGQPLGWVFDNPLNTIDIATTPLVGFDYTEFLDDAELRTPVVAYLLHLTETLIDGRPFIFYMTEFWKPLQDQYFTSFARDKLKTIRKQNGIGLFDTQSPSDVLIDANTGGPHPAGKTVVEQCVTKVFLPNPSADHDDYVVGFKTTEAEFEIVRSLSEASRLALVKQGQTSAVVRFDLGGMTEVLDVVSGSLDNVAVLDEARELVGDKPADWLPLFHSRLAQRRALKLRS